MATAAKFVQLIPIFLAHLVPLAVDVVPIKFHQFHCFAMAILVIILPLIFVHSISRRSLDQTL
jgi:hypothetical protein